MITIGRAWWFALRLLPEWYRYSIAPDFWCWLRRRDARLEKTAVTKMWMNLMSFAQLPRTYRFKLPCESSRHAATPQNCNWTEFNCVWHCTWHRFKPDGRHFKQTICSFISGFVVPICAVTNRFCTSLSYIACQATGLSSKKWHWTQRISVFWFHKPWFLVLRLLLEVFGESCVVGLTETGKVGKDTEDWGRGFQRFLDGSSPQHW